ncbi:hypothetical protein D3C81_1714410 [compost metagenome]
MKRQLIKPAILRFIGYLIHQGNWITIIFENRLMNRSWRFIRLLSENDVLRGYAQFFSHFLHGRKSVQYFGQLILFLAYFIRHLLQRTTDLKRSIITQETLNFSDDHRYGIR